MTIDAEPRENQPPAPTYGNHNLPPPRLRQELRRIAGLTQEDIAASFGVSDGAVSYWERRRPGRRYMGEYLRLLLSWAENASDMGLPVGWPTPQRTETQK